jgi:hypothetical protein
LDSLELPAPDDPFTEEPFEYEVTEAGARLRQAALEGVLNPADYALSVGK